MGFAVVSVFLILGLMTAVNDQRQSIHMNSEKTRLSALFGDSFIPGAWAAGEVTDNTIFVSGSATASASPDKVTVHFAVETQDDSAVKSQQDNAYKTAAVRSALTGIGISADDIETTGYTLSQVKDYDYQTRKYTYNGFKTVHSMKVELSDTGRAGEVIDAVVSAGVNNINSVTFGLSEAKMEELRLKALKEAAETTRKKADSIAEGLGISVNRVMSASEGYSYSPAVNTYRGMDMVAESAGSPAPTEITPGDVSVTATVSAVFEIA